MVFVYRGTSVYYTVQGSGRNLLFLHGWGADSTVFFPLIERYKNNYTVVAIDFPPFGLSGELAFDYTVQDYKNLVLSLLKSLNIEKTLLICHSFGGRVAAKLASESGLVEKAVFCSSAGLPKRKSILRSIKKIRYKLLKKLYRKADSGRLKKYFSKDYNNLPENMKVTFVNIINEDLTECIKQIKCPSLIIWGRKDRETPVYMARKFNKYIRGSKLKIIGGGHYCFLEDSKNFTANVDEFFRGKK
ncbi:MAG: alpha/beta hydrolase [Clostridia bacterium]|nr:alpha/beta hydrolase [Clostridia bacterium]